MRAGFALTVLLLLPLLPASAAPTAAGTCDAATPCAPIPLYLQAGFPSSLGLSSLPGDAMASDTTTRYTGGSLSAASDRVETPLTLSRTMRLSLPDFTAQGDVFGNVVVEARGATSNFTLAQIAIGPAGPQETQSQRALREINNALVTTPAPTVLEGTLESATDALPSPGAGLAENATTRAEATACISINACEQLHGDLGFATLRPCGDRNAPLLPRGLAATLGWTAQEQLDALDSGITLCGGRPSDNLTRGAREADAMIDARCDLAPCVLPDVDLPRFTHEPAPPTSNPLALRNLVFNATPPAWLPQDDASFTLPSGMRIGLRLELAARQNVEGRQASGALAFHYGRPDVPSALVVATSTPGAFAALVHGAEPIDAGTHTGAFSNITDADIYALQPPAMGRVRVTPSGAAASFTLYDENGKPKSGGIIDANASAGAWTLRVTNPPNTVPRGEYGFVLSYVEPKPVELDEADLQDGARTGELGPGDDVDAPVLFLWRAQRAEILLGATTGDLAYSLKLSDGLWIVERDGSRVLIQAKSSTFHTISFVRDFGAGTYAYSLARDAGGDLANVPFLQRLNHTFDSTPRIVGTEGSGVDLAGRVGDRIEIHHVTPAASTFVTTAASSSAFGRASDGSPIVIDAPDTDIFEKRLTAVIRRGGDDIRVAETFGFVLGPDEVYHTRGEVLYRTGENRTTEAVVVVPSDTSPIPLVHPSGELYFQSFNGGHVLREPGDLVMLPPDLRGIAGFDGDGRAYRVINGSLIQRVDMVTGDRVIVAQAAWGLSPASPIFVADGRVFTNAGIPPNGLQVPSYADIDAPGWSGFHPRLDMAPLADLVATRLDDVVVGTRVSDNTIIEDHAVTLRFSNPGEAAIGPFNATLRISCGLACSADATRTVEHPGLAAGASSSVTFLVGYRVEDAGDVEYQAGVNSLLGVGAKERAMEQSFSNNRVDGTSFAFAGGDRKACNEHVGADGACQSL